MKKSNKIAIVTAGGLNGRRLAAVFHELAIDFQLIRISYPMPKKRKGIKSLLKRLKAWIASLEFLRNYRMRHLPDYPVKGVYVGMQNGARMRHYLEKNPIDYIFMMGGGILKDEIIRTARKGVLNAHPGLLPFIRGVDAIAHSINQQIPPAVTTHFIDAGIDTGLIIERYILPISESTTLDTLTEESNHLCIASLTKLALRIDSDSPIPVIANEKKYPLYRKLHSSQLSEIELRIKEGLPTMAIPEKIELADTNELLSEYDKWWPKPKRF